MKEPIFICGFNKSGTTLLRSLLDHHPECSVLPSESHFFQWSGHYVHFALQSHDEISQSLDDAREMLVANFEDHQKELRAQTDQSTGGGAGFDGYQVEEFRRLFHECKPDNYRQLFEAYVHALNGTLDRGAFRGERRIVEKSVEHAEFAPILKQWFPRARFVHIVRNPYATLRSVREHLSTEKAYVYLGGILASMRRSYGNLLQNMRMIENYRVISYEDLVVDSKETMKKVADHLDIEFQTSLLRPTMFGESWGGNSTTGKEFAGISEDRLSGWRENLEPVEIEAVNRFASEVRDWFDYERVDVQTTYLQPASGETVKQYVANRGFIATFFNLR